MKQSKKYLRYKVDKKISFYMTIRYAYYYKTESMVSK